MKGNFSAAKERFNMKKAASFALGCNVTQYESEAIAEMFSEKGYEIVGIDE